jgi:glycosyltransferase involved in cell wall biosynthesis
VVRLLAGGLARRGQASSLIAVTTAGDPEPSWLDELALAGVTVLPLRLVGRAYYREFRELTAILQRLRPDIAHSHGYRSDVIGSLCARRLGIPTVTTVHGFTGGGWKNRVYEWLQCAAFRRFEAVVAVSRPLADRLRRDGIPEARLHLIPNAWGAAAAPLGRAEARGLLRLPAEGPVIGWVGRLSREKGADVMLDAFRRIPVPGLRLAVVGEGRERVALMAQAAAHGIAERVTWHGLVPDAGRIYSAFNVFALTSRTEGTPIALFEAMHAGTPVVATRVGGVPDAVSSEEALLVPSEDPGAVADAVALLLQDQALANRLAAAAARRLQRDHALDPWLDRYLQLYRDLR